MDSLNEYVYRGTRPKPMAVPPPKRISSPAGQRLSTIIETLNGTSAAQQTANRPVDQRFNIGTPPRASEEKRPPSYSSEQGRLTNEERARLQREPQSFKERLSRRGGWKKLAIIVGVVLLIIIALAVGLGVGLSMNNSNQSDSSDNHSGSGHSLGPFPAGSWYFDAFLVDVSSECTSNAHTWDCYPYQTYSQAGAQSETSLNWIIKSSSSAESGFMISSSANPWAPVFHSKPLELKAANTSEEHYAFSIDGMRKVVHPNVDLIGSNNSTICQYNATLSANIYTRKAATLSSQDGTSSTSPVAMSNGHTIKTWSHAVQIDQVAHGGSNVPKCYRSFNNKPVGPPINLPSKSSSSTCSCLYKNFMS